MQFGIAPSQIATLRPENFFPKSVVTRFRQFRKYSPVVGENLRHTTGKRTSEVLCCMAVCGNRLPPPPGLKQLNLSRSCGYWVGRLGKCFTRDFRFRPLELGSFAPEVTSTDAANDLTTRSFAAFFLCATGGVPYSEEFLQDLQEEWAWISILFILSNSDQPNASGALTA